MPVSLATELPFGALMLRTQLKYEFGSLCVVVMLPPALNPRPLARLLALFAPPPIELESSEEGASEPENSRIPAPLRSWVAKKSRPLDEGLPPTTPIVTPPPSPP